MCHKKFIVNVKNHIVMHFFIRFQRFLKANIGCFLISEKTTENLKKTSKIFYQVFYWTNFVKHPQVRCGKETFINCVTLFFWFFDPSFLVI